MSEPTKEYLLAKANMCRNLALTQINAGEGEKAAKNLMRMVKALGEVGIIIEREDKEMSKEVKLVFTAFIKVTGDDPIAEAMSKAQDDYGNEVADYGSFTLVEGEDNE
jgi:hypothetical protein